MDGRTVPERTIDVLAGLNADIIALQEVIGAGPNDSGHAEEIGAALGMGWVMASVRHLRGHQFGNVVLSHFPDSAARPVRPVVAHMRAALLPARRHPHRRQDAAPLQRAPRHRVPRAEGSGRAPRGRSCTTAASHPPKILLGDFNEWSGGLATAALTRQLQAIDLSTHLRRKRTYPGILPLLHLDHIYYEGEVEIAGVEIPRTRKSLMASDHLPFLAELRVGFE